MTEELRALIIGNKKPEQLGDIAAFHIQYVQHGGDSRTASLISYMKVDAGKLCHLLHVEQNRYREETEPLVMD